MKIPNGVSPPACASMNPVRPFPIGNKLPFSRFYSCIVGPLKYNIILMEISELDFLVVLGNSGLLEGGIRKGRKTPFFI